MTVSSVNKGCVQHSVESKYNKTSQDCHLCLWNGLCSTFLINLFCCIVCKFVWISCVAQVEGAAQWLSRVNISFMFVLCSRQIPVKVNKLILAYLMLITHETGQSSRLREAINLCNFNLPMKE